MIKIRKRKCQCLPIYCCSWSLDKLAGMVVGMPGMTVFSSISVFQRLLFFFFRASAPSEPPPLHSPTATVTQSQKHTLGWFFFSPHPPLSFSLFLFAAVVIQGCQSRPKLAKTTSPVRSDESIILPSAQCGEDFSEFWQLLNHRRGNLSGRVCNTKSLCENEAEFRMPVLS